VLLGGLQVRKLESIRCGSEREVISAMVGYAGGRLVVSGISGA
jgi:hypothetical protein